MKIDYCPNCNARLDVRSSEQNRLLHGLIGDIAEQKEWAGQKLDIECWKRLLVAGWERAIGRQARLFPAIDGNGFDVVYQRTSRLSKSELSELYEYISAWAADNGVKASYGNVEGN